MDQSINLAHIQDISSFISFLISRVWSSLFSRCLLAISCYFRRDMPITWSTHAMMDITHILVWLHFGAWAWAWRTYALALSDPPYEATLHTLSCNIVEMSTWGGYFAHISILSLVRESTCGGHLLGLPPTLRTSHSWRIHCTLVHAY
jgi:hypothetical protein